MTAQRRSRCSGASTASAGRSGRPASKSRARAGRRSAGRRSARCRHCSSRNGRRTSARKVGLDSRSATAPEAARGELRLERVEAQAREVFGQRVERGPQAGCRVRDGGQHGQPQALRPLRARRRRLAILSGLISSRLTTDWTAAAISSFLGEERPENPADGEVVRLRRRSRSPRRLGG